MRTPRAGGPGAMSGFQVAPVEGGCPVALPPGETVIGRGPLLGITDKRVSRKHAILKVMGDQLCIKPVHVNPCFYRPSEHSQFLPLDSDEWHHLSPGDNFSLLVDKCVFRVVFPHTDMDGLKSWNDAEEMPNQTSKMPPERSTLQQIPSSNHGKLLEGQSVLERTTETPQKLSASRKRVLPAWMLQGDLTVPSSLLSVPGNRNNEERRKSPAKKQKTTTSSDAALSLQAVQGVATESAVPKVENNNSRSVSLIPKTVAMQNECSEPSQSAYRSTESDPSNMRGIEEDRGASKAESEGMPSQSLVHQDENKVLIPDQTTEADSSDSTGSSSVPQSSNLTKHTRIPCQYGRNCYRKNPIHFQQFSHPGDADCHDPEVGTAAVNDPRPECPYGTTCYRKNPQHKKEYKHTAPPEPERKQTRPKPIKKGRSLLEDDSDNEGRPNEYDLDDSFIDDEEEEECEPTDEDSDWEPDFEGKDDEDVDTLLEEAQEFVKTKK
ncbi:aprataxin and PNK-like factor isoform X2 [Paroedura picta]|uniref:aprataxin and PNK-like factor isoform X2 n=1 Tax=Paroedura picta TaxID=143630 RepID=UPI004056E665